MDSLEKHHLSPEHGGNVDQMISSYGFKASEILDFSVNINPFGPPPILEDVMKDSNYWSSLYPEPDPTQVSGILAQWHEIPKNSVTAANGATELIYWAPRLVLNPQALILSPTFTEYERSVISSGGLTEHWIVKKEDGFRHDFHQITRNSIEKSNLLFICNPNNPTGALYTKWTLEDAIKSWHEINPNLLCVIDESFLSFISGEENYSLISFAIEDKRVIILRSLTKILSVPGLRLGYAVGHPETISKLNSILPFWRVNIFAQKLAKRIFDCSEFIQKSKETVQSCRRNFLGELRTVPAIHVYESSSNFVLIKIKNKKITALGLRDDLAKNKIMVRCCDDFTGLAPNRFIRLAVKKEADNQFLVRTLETVLKKYG